MKMVIADDEILALDLLENIMDWKSKGIEIVGKALNGLDATRLIQKHQPEIVLTDIRMPQLDGLGLIQWIRANHYDIKVVIISAHAEFEYAQKALSFGAAGFLLKPLDEIKLGELLDKLVFEIKHKQEMQNSIKQSRKIVEEKLFKQLLIERNDNKKLIQRLQGFNVPVDFSKYLLMNISTDTMSYSEFLRLSEISESQALDIRDYLEQRISNYHKAFVVFENSHNEWIVLMTAGEVKLRPKEIANLLVKSLFEELNIKCFIGISRVYHESSDLYKAYSDTLDLLKYRFYLGSSQVIDYLDINRNYNVKEIKSLEKVYLLVAYLNEGNGSKALETLEETFNEMAYTASIDPDEIYYFCFELLLLLKQKVLKDQKQDNLVLDFKDISLDYLKQYETFQSLKGYVVETFNRIMKAPMESSKAETSRLIKKAKDYIYQNYDKDITLEAICESINISKNYFCYLFKREVGEGIWDYLTRFRIEKAKEFIKSTDMKSYEVSCMVGYENPSYFSKIFKRLTGFTPQEFRDIS